MNENQNVEARVDELSKAGNEAELEKVLSLEFNNEENPAEDKTADDDKSEKNNVNSDENNQDKSEDDNKSNDKNSEDHSNDGDKNTGDKADKTNRIKDLLADRNKAKEEAAKAQSENSILSKRIEDLTELVQKLTSDKTGEGDKSEDNSDLSADEIKSKEDVAKLVEEILEKKQLESSKALDAEKSITEGIQELISKKDDFPNAENFKKEITDVMKQFPTMKARAAYALLKGDGIIPSEEISSNANRTGTSGRSKSNLIKSKNADDMTQAEREAYLFDQQKSGTLNV